MRQALNIGKEPNLQRIVIISAVFHLLFIALITIPIKTKEKEYKSYFVNLVSPLEIQRITKSPVLNKKRKAIKKTVKVKPSPRRKVKSERGVTLEPAERVIKEIERLRAINTLSKLKKQTEQKIARAREADEALEHAIEGIRKRKLITVLKGIGIKSSQVSKNSESYYAVITQKIWSEWIYPDFNNSGLEVIISIKIDNNGRVISQEIEKSSGSPLFDRSASNAISKASPLPPPPVEMEIGVRFYL